MQATLVFCAANDWAFCFIWYHVMALPGIAQYHRCCFRAQQMHLGSQGVLITFWVYDLPLWLFVACLSVAAQVLLHPVPRSPSWNAQLSPHLMQVS